MPPRKAAYKEITLVQIDAHKASLSPEHHEILTATLDKTYEEVAAALTMPLGTVRSRLNRAREALQHQINKTLKHDNGKPMYAPDGKTPLNDDGTRSIFSDVDA
jgi:DNA-directed RNA polymerase specialized sigma24 family protein